MKFKTFTGIIGAILVISGGLFPMLRLPILGNWNYWDLDVYLACIVYTLAILALFAAIGNKNGLLKFCGWTLLLLLIFTFAAVQFKITNYFSFIPLKKMAALAGKIVKIQWTGWAMIFTGTVLMIFSAKKRSKQIS